MHIQLKVLQFVLNFNSVFKYVQSETSNTLTSFLLSSLLYLFFVKNVMYMTTGRSVFNLFLNVNPYGQSLFTWKSASVISVLMRCPHSGNLPPSVCWFVHVLFLKETSCSFPAFIIKIILMVRWLVKGRLAHSFISTPFPRSPVLFWSMSSHTTVQWVELCSQRTGQPIDRVSFYIKTSRTKSPTEFFCSESCIVLL